MMDELKRILMLAVALGMLSVGAFAAAPQMYDQDQRPPKQPRVVPREQKEKRNNNERPRESNNKEQRGGDRDQKKPRP